MAKSLPRLYDARGGAKKYRRHNPLTKRSEWGYIRAHEFDGTDRDAERVLKAQLGVRPEHRPTHTNELFLHYALRVIREIPLTHVTQKYRDGMEKAVEQHMTCLHGIRVDSIQFKDVYRVITDMEAKPKPFRSRSPQKGYAGNTIKNVMATLHRILNRAVKDEYLTKNPCDMLESHERPEIDVEEPRILKRSELQVLLRAAVDYSKKKQARHAAVFALALFAGLRKSEIIRLCWSDIDFDNMIIWVRKDDRVRRVKTKNSVRPVEMCELLRDILWQHRLEMTQANELDLVFCSRDGNPVPDSNIQKMQTEVLLRSGLWQPESDDLELRKKPTLHPLRHNYVSVLMAQNVDKKKRLQQAGHASEEFQTNTYAHVVEELSKGMAAAAIDAHWAGQNWTEIGQNGRANDEDGA